MISSYTVCAAVSVHLHKVVGHVLLCDNRAPVVLHQDVCNCIILVYLGESTGGLDTKKAAHLTKGLINLNKSSLWPFTGTHSKYSISSRC